MEALNSIDSAAETAKTEGELAPRIGKASMAGKEEGGELTHPMK
jgi:hypothetical protein